MRYSRFRLRIPRLLLSLCLALGSSTMLNAQTAPASQTQPPAQGTALAAASATGPSAELRISPDDVLDIYVVDVPELSRQYRVSPAGLLNLPLLDEPVAAAGLKATELSTTLSTRLRDAGLVSNPHVAISVVSSRLKSVAINGAVRMPQLYPVFGGTTLLDVLSQAQGVTEDAGSVALITRGGQSDTGETAATVETVDLTRLLETGSAADNPAVYAGDRITIPTAGIVYVVGAVVKPGGFSIRSSREGMTVLKAVALAEGLRPTAVRSKVTIIRTAAGGREQLPLDLKKILAGKAKDPVLQASDILFVPDSEGAKALRRSLEAALQVATGVVIYHR